MTDDQRAYQYVCPACNAQPGQKCTTPTNTTRRAVPWIHWAREDLIQERRPHIDLDRETR
jgi:hypothetical protein